MTTFLHTGNETAGFQNAQVQDQSTGVTQPIASGDFINNFNGNSQVFNAMVNVASQPAGAKYDVNYFLDGILQNSDIVYNQQTTLGIDCSGAGRWTVVLKAEVGNPDTNVYELTFDVSAPSEVKWQQDAGVVSTFSLGAGASKDVVIPYSTVFNNVPIPVYSLNASNADPLYTTEAGVTSRTQTSFTVHVTNKGAALAYYMIDWIAIAKL